MGVSTCWTGICMECNNGMENGTKQSTYTELTRATGAVQSISNSLVYLSGCYLTSEDLWAISALSTVMLLYLSMVLVLLLAHHQVLCYCSLVKPDSHRKATVWLCETIVMELSSWSKMWWQELVLDPQSKFAWIFIYTPQSSVTPMCHSHKKKPSIIVVSMPPYMLL